MALKEKIKRKFKEISKMGNPNSPSKNPIVRGYKAGVRKNIRRLDERGNKVFTDLESGADTKRKSAEVRKKKDPKNQSLRPKARPKKKAAGGSLKAVPEGNKGLKKLPTAVRNKMGFMKDGGQVSLLSDQYPDIFKKPSGQARGMGAASRGGKFSRDG